MINKLTAAAKKARLNSYSPYSKCKVGAAILTKSGNIYSGCNVENSSYGATNCAERVAIQSAIAHEGKVELLEVVVVTDANPPWPPCGICRQVIAEFGPTAKITAVNLKKKISATTLKKALPDAFTPDRMKRGKK